MSTNFYHYAKPPCPTCGHQPEPRHIGLSAVGWAFALHLYPADGINTLADWQSLWKIGTIKDEYGRELTPEAMEMCVTARRPDCMHSAIGAGTCIANGSGTWDYHTGEYS